MALQKGRFRCQAPQEPRRAGRSEPDRRHLASPPSDLSRAAIHPTNRQTSYSWLACGWRVPPPSAGSFALKPPRLRLCGKLSCSALLSDTARRKMPGTTSRTETWAATYPHPLSSAMTSQPTLHSPRQEMMQALCSGLVHSAARRSLSTLQRAPASQGQN